MWIASKYGFFSIVKKEDGHHVRARVKRDLETLIAETGIEEPLQQWPAADYRYRVVVSAQAIPALFEKLGESIDYSNFKSKIAATPTQRDKEHAYYEIWRVMYGLQEDDEAYS
ncbi:hypothetical protein K3G39_06850 [Pontibacter sp. HSC-14F20]|uniref:hypothetical protein n=1 Tax=Pontibacter sp. HSC-14F20 TaxID=2864136 RepID=UPI001C73094B|nr:hypothetical protein [Pontibacter sp. HSC-14F20]MBX0332951.1 hypothetical protein [Pontibacter sp. HSC-14F20]